MQAIIETGGKQYTVEKGSVIEVELLKEKENIEFNQVLFLNNNGEIKVGSPNIEKCSVQGKVVEETKGPKVIAYKYKRRQNYRRKKGHRQKYLKVEITDIKVG